MPSLSSLLRSSGRAGRPEKALPAIAALREELEALERHHVATAVAEGWSWSRVAKALGVTKQAAHKKHAQTVRALAPDPREAVPSDARVVVTAEARRAVRCARDEAREAGSTTVGTEHLLLGVLRVRGSVAARALANAGVTLDAARAGLQVTESEVEHAAAGESRETAEAARATGVSPLARACLERSLREALERGDGHLGIEHVLLALLAGEQSGAVRTLELLGVQTDALERALRQTDRRPEARSAT